MAPKHAELPIFIPANFYYKTFTVGIKSKNLPRTTRFGLWYFIEVFYNTTTCPRQPLLRDPKSGLSIQVWNYKYPACIFIFYYVFFFLNKSFFKTTLANHRTNLRSILWSQLFIKYKHYIKKRKRNRKKGWKYLINN